MQIVGPYHVDIGDGAGQEPQLRPATRKYKTNVRKNELIRIVCFRRTAGSSGYANVFEN